MGTHEGHLVFGAPCAPCFGARPSSLPFAPHQSQNTQSCRCCRSCISLLVLTVCTISRMHLLRNSSHQLSSSPCFQQHPQLQAEHQRGCRYCWVIELCPCIFNDFPALSTCNLVAAAASSLVHAAPAESAVQNFAW